MPKSIIRRLTDRGYGFIKGEGGKDLFFHGNDLQGVEFNTLREGQEVEFDTGEGRDGRPRAVKVRLTETQTGGDVSDDGGDGGEAAGNIDST